MSLMQLLAVGQSLVGIKNKPSPYRVARQKWLPTFGPAGPSNTAGVESKTLRAPGAGTWGAEGQEGHGGARVDHKPVKSKWLSWRRGAKASRPLQQAELKLEQVEVVRNDLSDCDFEVIPRLLGTSGSGSGRAAELGSQAESNRLAGRLYKAVRTVV